MKLDALKIREAVGAIVERKSTFLLVYKVKAMDTLGGPVDIAGEWGFPGGGVIKGEDIEMALRRELSEETGMTTYDIVRELPSLEFEFAADYRERSGYEQQRTRMFLIRCTSAIEIAANDSEIDSVQFFAKGDVPSILHHPSSKDYFQSLIASGLLD